MADRRVDLFRVIPNTPEFYSLHVSFDLNMLRPESRHLEVVRQTHPHMWVGRDPHLIKVGA